MCDFVTSVANYWYLIRVKYNILELDALDSVCVWCTDCSVLNVSQIGITWISVACCWIRCLWKMLVWSTLFEWNVLAKVHLCWSRLCNKVALWFNFVLVSHILIWIYVWCLASAVFFESSLIMDKFVVTK